ncbi:hypothetical protein [Paraferrimonas sedimenticola]|uniref:Chemotaxis protein n=1 Tax=Paraferrimonas sedimenticola TaxID=375674 RepID=A0AA37RWS9_9GAMM|nr:hypothetical protein [Paraferrimonas sedimenticola]GLP96753.1 hypothetical protein GCM10007895_20590 [Paraferrimonas sedimenticola]
MKQIAILTLHGMGNQTRDYSKDLEHALAERLGLAWEQVYFHPIYYADLLQGPQQTLWEAMKAEPTNRLDFEALRQFLLYSLGDAASLEYSAHRNRGQYDAVQQRISQSLLAAYDALGGEAKPVIVVAHSLGCQVFSNYCWDLTHDEALCKAVGVLDDKACEFVRLRSLASMVTLGCNIPLFVSGLERRECFTRPNEAMRWLNLYDPDDVLGWPVRQLGPSFKWVEDYPTHVGGVTNGWSPLSHMAYWQDRDVIQCICDQALSLLK